MHKVLGLSFSGKTSVERYQEYLTNDWMKLNCYPVLILSAIHLLLTVKMHSLLSSDEPLTYAVIVALFHVPWFLCVLFNYGAITMMLGMTGPIYSFEFLSKNIACALIPIAYLLFKPVQWVVGYQMVNDTA